MTPRVLIVLLFTTVILACVHPPEAWRHPTKSEQELHQDYAECMSMGAEAQANSSASIVSDAVRESVYKSCMRGRGYEPAE